MNEKNLLKIKNEAEKSKVAVILNLIKSWNKIRAFLLSNFFLREHSKTNVFKTAVEDPNNSKIRMATEI